MFAGRDECARAWSPSETARFNDHDSLALLKPTLEAIAACHPANRIDALELQACMLNSAGRETPLAKHRSRVESKLHCVKALGHRLLVQGFDRQVAERLFRIGVLNVYTTLGICVRKAAE